MGKKAAIDTDSAMASLSLDDMKAVRERLCMALIFWQLVLPLLWLILPWIFPGTDFILRRCLPRHAPPRALCGGQTP